MRIPLTILGFVALLNLAIGLLLYDQGGGINLVIVGFALGVAVHIVNMSSPDIE